MKYNIVRLMIVDSRMSSDRGFNEEADKAQRQNLVNYLGEGYEIYHSTTYSCESLNATVYVLRKAVV